MAFWWVNQSQTWRHEISGEYLWSQKRDAKGRQIQNYENMTLLALGDVVLSHFDGALRYAGVVVSPAASSPQPDHGGPAARWPGDGWFVEMRFVALTPPVEPQRFLDLYNEVAPERYAPMTSEGRVNQQYLFALPEVLGRYFLAAAGLHEESVRDAARSDPTDAEVAADLLGLRADETLSPAERHELSRARVGEGSFKERVRRVEPSCRLTGLSDPGHLVARHLKPWRVASREERLNGHNGLLLSPHVDRLVDRGLITFEDSGRVVASPHLAPTVIRAWGLDLARRSKRFSAEQVPYLEHHRDHVFRAEWTPRLGDLVLPAPVTDSA